MVTVTFQFAEPMFVPDQSRCTFYHTMDLPGLGEVKGGIDLRSCTDAYLGNFDFKGKRALDVGAASGYLSFSMEQRGAEVVSYDIGTGSDWDVVPHYKIRDQLPKMRKGFDSGAIGTRRAYWLSHRLLGSRAKAYYGNIYKLPSELGEFDVVFYGMILTHLRDPFQALYSGARLSRDAVVVTGSFSKTESPASVFRPNAADTSYPALKGWWLLSIGTMRNMLGVLGFDIKKVVEVQAKMQVPGREEVGNFQSIVAHRFK
jgi:hypothetical protein